LKEVNKRLVVGIYQTDPLKENVKIEPAIMKIMRALNKERRAIM